MTETLKSPRPSLTDVTAGFTFSRLPRAERITKILTSIIADEGIATLDEDSIGVIALALEPYARRDFAVRYGRLDDIGTTKNFG